MDSADGHVDDADADFLWQGGYERATEVVNGCQSVVRAAQRRQGRIPLAHLAAAAVVVHGSHHEETGIHAFEVLCLRAGSAFHIRLSEAEEDVEIGVGSSTGADEGCSQQRGHHERSEMFHCTIRVDGDYNFVCKVITKKALLYSRNVCISSDETNFNGWETILDKYSKKK